MGREKNGGLTAATIYTVGHSTRTLDELVGML